MIKFIKRDFNNISFSMNCLCKRELPIGILVLYYIVMLPLGLLTTPFAWVYSKIVLRKMNKEIKKWSEA